MKLKLGNRSVVQLKPQDKAYEVVDTELKGFLLRVQPSGMMTYYYSYRNQARKRLRFRIGQHGTLSVAQARQIAEQLAAKVAMGEDIQAQKKTAIIKANEDKQNSLRQFLETLYLDWAVTHLEDGEDTVKEIKRDFASFLAMPLEKIDVFKLEQWKSKMAQEKQYKPATFNRKIGRLKAVLAKAVEWDLLVVHPLAKLKPLKLDENPPTRFLSEAEEQRLRRYLRQRDQEKKAQRARYNYWRRERHKELLPDITQDTFVDYMEPMILLSINLGFRKNVTLQLTWDRINFEKRYVIALGENTKTNQSRYLPMNDETFYVLQAWRKQTSSPHYLFLNPDTGKPYTDVKKAWKTILNKAGIEDFRWHDMRHHFGSKLANHAVPLNTIRELMGHKSMRMTLRYAHLDAKHKAEAVAQLGNDVDLEHLK